MKSAKMRVDSTFLFAIFTLMILSDITNPVAARSVFHYYWVTVTTKSPQVTGNIGHSTVGWEWNFTYEALWDWGERKGEIIPNATIPIEVYDVANESNPVLVDNFTLITDNMGQVSFVYSSPVPRVLRFKPTKLITQDGVEYNSSLYETTYEPYSTASYYNLYGFTSSETTIYWDDFDISIASVDVNQLGTSKVTVNLTYQIIPPEGIWVGMWDPENTNYIPKYVSNANVTVNGIKASETSPGLYEAQVSTWLPTASFDVKVSKNGWHERSKTFSFVHNANQVVWVAVSVSLGIVFAALLLYHFLFARRRQNFERAPKAQSARVSFLIYSLTAIA